MDDINFAGKCVGEKHPPMIIAEMSGNHNQSLDRALKIVEAAADAGAHALKLQTYTADTITLNIGDGEFFISDPGSPWRGTSLYDLYKSAYTPWEWHKSIFDRCRELGLTAFSTPFDFTAVEFLEDLGVPAYKIASFENNDLPLIEKIAFTGKPILMSTGMATADEIDEAVHTIKRTGNDNIVLLKCTSTYPASVYDSNVKTIPDIKRRFGVQAGLSDHTLGIGAALAAIAQGATVVEKHFTLSRADGGVDAAFSMEPEEMRLLVRESENAWRSLGSVHYGPTSEERKSLVFRRSLYVSRDIKAGEPFTENNVRSIRPGNGLPPCYYRKVLNGAASVDLKKGTPLSWDLVKEK